MTFSEILIEITGGQNPLCTIKEVAHEMRKEPPTIYGYRNGNQPNWEDGVALANYLREEYGYYTLAMQTLLSCVGGACNGSVDDEILDIMEATVMIRKGFNEGDNTMFHNGMGMLTRAYENLKKEGDSHL